MRDVLDTNVLISALIFPGGGSEFVYRFVLEERIGLITSRTLLAELGLLLEAKFGWEPARVEQAVSQLTRVATLVGPTEVIGEITADPANNRVLEAAAGAPRVAVKKLGKRAVGTSCPASARKLASPMPRTPGVNQERRAGVEATDPLSLWQGQDRSGHVYASRMVQ